MTSPSSRLAELGLALPAVAAPLAAYVPAVRTGSLVFTSGQLPMVDGALPVDRAGRRVRHAGGRPRECARACALNALPRSTRWSGSTPWRGS